MHMCGRARGRAAHPPRRLRTARQRRAAARRAGPGGRARHAPRPRSLQRSRRHRPAGGGGRQRLLAHHLSRRLRRPLRGGRRLLPLRPRHRAAPVRGPAALLRGDRRQRLLLRRRRHHRLGRGQLPPRGQRDVRQLHRRHRHRPRVRPRHPGPGRAPSTARSTWSSRPTASRAPGPRTWPGGDAPDLHARRRRPGPGGGGHDRHPRRARAPTPTRRSPTAAGSTG